MSDWYAARILTGKEKVIQWYMDRDQISVFFPIVEERRIFPGYAFFGFDAESDWWYDINNTHGVIHLLPVKQERPLALPRSFIPTLKDNIAAGGYSIRAATKLTLSYVPGDKVPVIEGTYAGMTGELVKYNKDSLMLLMWMFNRKMEVPVLKEDVKAA